MHLRQMFQHRRDQDFRLKYYTFHIFNNAKLEAVNSSSATRKKQIQDLILEQMTAIRDDYAQQFGRTTAHVTLAVGEHLEEHRDVELNLTLRKTLLNLLSNKNGRTRQQKLKLCTSHNTRFDNSYECLLLKISQKIISKIFKMIRYFNFSFKILYFFKVWQREPLLTFDMAIIADRQFIESSLPSCPK